MREMCVEVEPVTVDFPLRGEWEAEHTPAERVPSHGTDQLGQSYAFDFVRIESERKGLKFFRGSMLRYFLLGVKLDECYGWSEPIFAPFSGMVVAAKDGWPERKRLHLLRDLAVVLKNALVFDPKRTNDLRPLLGSHVILEMPEKEVYAFFAHARFGSIRVREGEEVRMGQQLAEVGHSGNSTAPHLHFHIMDRANILEAKGLPCQFREYEALHDGGWRKVSNGIPGKREFVRYAP
jgi:murein DD-endopeptidase MepM/ murein hydrolase activator NlpD